MSARGAYKFAYVSVTHARTHARAYARAVSCDPAIDPAHPLCGRLPNDKLVQRSHHLPRRRYARQAIRLLARGGVRRLHPTFVSGGRAGQHNAIIIKVGQQQPTCPERYNSLAPARASTQRAHRRTHARAKRVQLIALSSTLCHHIPLAATHVHQSRPN
jgi:hypothetical protein